MVNALVIRPNTQLAKAQKALRAAQYVRMSTERQRYSIENQAATIAAYAQAHNFSIVRTYRDEGESGLRLKNRAGLLHLLDDVQSDHADFGHILIYDVSRWGRFQDIDESAYYEFICKQAGIKVSYCAEQFHNDGSMVSSIVKNIKRVMAAEYSRELSVKVHAGACRMARMGFKSGGPTPYALQRVLVDEKSHPKEVLKKGDRKYIQTDHIRLRPGGAKEVTVVKWIFRRFLDVKSEKAIARELTRHDIPPCSGERWTGPKITRILKNENYIGNIVCNRQSKKLGGTRVRNSPNQWVRGKGHIEPIIALDDFRAVQKIISERRVDGLTEGEMLSRLRRTLKKEGRISTRFIDKTAGLPSNHTYRAHFGNMRNVYGLIGYSLDRNFEYLDSRKVWHERLSELHMQLAEKFKKAGGHVASNEFDDGLRVNGTINVYFRIAQIEHPTRDRFASRWIIQRRNLPDGWIIAIRLADRCKTVLDYLLVPTIRTDRNTIRFSEKRRAGLGIVNFETPEALARSLIQRVTRSNPVAPPKLARPNKRSKKVAGGLAPH